MSVQKPHTGRKPLPPFARQWLIAGSRYGPQVICGPGAWAFAEHRRRCGGALVAPPGQDPLQFDWSPLKGRSVVLIEVGTFDTPALERLAYAILRDGAELVHPIRKVPDAPAALPVAWPSYSRRPSHGRP